MSAFVRTVRIIFSVAVCCSAAFADMHPGRSSPAAEPPGSGAPDTLRLPENKSADVALPKLALLVPDLTGRSKDTLSLAEPFDMPANVRPPEDMAAKWDELQSRILADQKTIAACRSDESACSAAARRFLSLIDLGGKHQRRAQLGWLNRAVNLAIRPESDWAQYGYADFWASPLQTLGSGAGDCEDYAIVKYVALRELGFAAGDLRFIVVRDDKHQVEHAIVAVRDGQEWLILDNRTMTILSARDDRHYIPLFALDQENAQTFAAAAVNPVIDR